MKQVSYSSLPSALSSKVTFATMNNCFIESSNAAKDLYSSLRVIVSLPSMLELITFSALKFSNDFITSVRKFMNKSNCSFNASAFSISNFSGLASKNTDSSCFASQWK